MDFYLGWFSCSTKWPKRERWSNRNDGKCWVCVGPEALRDVKQRPPSFSTWSTAVVDEGYLQLSTAGGSTSAGMELSASSYVCVSCSAELSGLRLRSTTESGIFLENKLRRYINLNVRFFPKLTPRHTQLYAWRSPAWTWSHIDIVLVLYGRLWLFLSLCVIFLLLRFPIHRCRICIRQHLI